MLEDAATSMSLQAAIVLMLQEQLMMFLFCLPRDLFKLRNELPLAAGTALCLTAPL